MTTTTTDRQPSIVLDKPSRDVVKGARWWRELGWRYVVGIGITVIVVIPLLYIVSASLNPIGSVSSTSLIPKQISFTHFESLGNNPARPFFKWFGNSLLVALVVVTVNSLLSSFGAYAFSRMRFKGRRSGLLALLLIQMFPGILTMVALFRMFGIIGDIVPWLGLDSLAGYTFVMLGGALGGVFLMKGIFDSIPDSLDEAAKIDGAGHFRVYATVIMPLVKSILVINGLLALTGVIGEFLLASIFLRSNGVKTVAVGLYGVLTSDRSANLGWFCAAALVVSIPVVVLFQWLQKYIVGGITAGSVKG
ncbi:carbohydrate ABC transporter membrane protein 2 (CUT1 family) [Salana multivorans]|uniref:Carbohydrate ABC transporter membrane protein 2 (CUT1 family) n=1 Tax=Salana multivorans TaxID=120377 RepID=A0A3N2D0F3_9MICO|nr:sugar ABC transporter permease [Salana multivorans]ROR93262.1 carbohydrate ABC transporter membrane protein 2 (CUT1 family) [Salana multivorans]